MISGPGYNSKGTLEEERVTENPRVVAGDTDPIGEGRAIQGKDRISVFFIVKVFFYIYFALTGRNV